jgi:hypothetical protein
MAEFLVCTGSQVLFPDITDPVPATIIIERSTGKIIDVRRNQVSREQLPFESVEWIDAGDKIVLPGLVEYVLPFSHIWYLTPLYLVPTSTLMNQVAPHGKVSGRGAGLLPQVVSLPWLICP